MTALLFHHSNLSFKCATSGMYLRRHREREALIAFPSGVGLDELVFFAECFFLPSGGCVRVVSEYSGAAEV
jgi:hypothetical protein